MQTKQELFPTPDLRINILKATQAGRLVEVEQLLQQTPSLISAKTTSTQTSLLHLAAKHGHLDLCRLFLDNHHETNPVDKEGKTPYQYATRSDIRDILVKAHSQLLFDQFLPAHHLDAPGKPYIHAIEKMAAPVDKVMFSRSIVALTARKGNYRDVMAYTAFSPFPNITSNTFILYTHFREDLLMIPYWGELLVILENEQIVQIHEILTQSNHTTEAIALLTESLAYREARSFMQSISTILTRYPFLKEDPLPSDRPDVRSAKKLILGYGVHGYIPHYVMCTEAQKRQLVKQPGYSILNEQVERLCLPENSRHIDAYRDEINSIYEINAPHPGSTLSHK